MKNRNKVLVLTTVLSLFAAMAYSAISPYGIFGGPPTAASLPSASGSGSGTLAFTSDTGALISNGTSWFRFPATVVGTTFTITSGCATVSALTGGTTAGSFATTLTGTCTPVIALPTAPNGWVCLAVNLTHPAVFTQTASTTTSCTVSGASTASDVVEFTATAF